MLNKKHFELISCIIRIWQTLQPVAKGFPELDVCKKRNVPQKNFENTFFKCKLNTGFNYTGFNSDFRSVCFF